MIIETSGNLLDSSADILVNPVNCVGVMGKGLALQFKKKFPENFSTYKKYCNKGKLYPGHVLSTKEKGKIILNVATKQHWKAPSYILHISRGLTEIKRILEQDYEEHLAIAMPAIGCGLGMLDWDVQVKPLIFSTMKDQRNSIYLFSPKNSV